MFKFIYNLEYLFFSGLLFLTVSSCQSDTPNSTTTNHNSVESTITKVNDWKLSRLKGQVKISTEKTYRSAAQAMVDRPVSVTRTSFYENGNIQEMLTEMDDGSKRNYRYQYKADSIFVHNWLLRADTVVERQEYIYLKDAQGARNKMMLPAPLGQDPNYYAEIRNNEEGLPIEYSHHLKNEADRLQMPCKEVRKYDENNFLISEEMHRYNPKDGSCNPTNTIRHYKNDEQGNCIEERIVKSGTTVLSKHRYEYRYDAKGNWIEKNRYTELAGKEEISLVVLRKFEFY